MILGILVKFLGGVKILWWGGSKIDIGRSKIDLAPLPRGPRGEKGPFFSGFGVRIVVLGFHETRVPFLGERKWDNRE